MDTQRISIDLDDPAPVHVLAVWHALAYLGATGIHGRISSGGWGVHIIATPPTDMDDIGVLETRRAYDDQTRVYLDEVAPDGKPRDILFSEKHGRHAGQWQDNIERLMAALYGD